MSSSLPVPTLISGELFHYADFASHLKQLRPKEPEDCAHVNNPPHLWAILSTVPILPQRSQAKPEWIPHKKGAERSNHLWLLLIWWSACGISTLLVAHETFLWVTGHRWFQRCQLAAQCPHVLFPKSRLLYKIPGVEASCRCYFSNPYPFLPVF